MKAVQEKTALCMPRRAASGEMKPSNTLILDFQPLDLQENELGLGKALGLWLFIMAALSKLRQSERKKSDPRRGF